MLQSHLDIGSASSVVVAIVVVVAAVVVVVVVAVVIVAAGRCATTGSSTPFTMFESSVFIDLSTACALSVVKG